MKEVEDEQDVNRQPRSDRTHPLGSIAQHHEQPRLMEPKPHDPDPEQRHEDLPVAQIADVLLLRDAPPRRALLRAVRPVGVVVASSCRRSAWGDCGRCVRGSWGSPRRVPHRRRPRVRTRSEGTRAAGSPARLLQRGERVLSTARTKGCQTKVEMSGSCTRSRVVAARCDEPPRLEHLHSYSRVPAPLLPSTSRTTPPRGCRWVTSCASSPTRCGRPLRSRARNTRCSWRSPAAAPPRSAATRRRSTTRAATGTARRATSTSSSRSRRRCGRSSGTTARRSSRCSSGPRRRRSWRWRTARHHDGAAHRRRGSCSSIPASTRW